MAQAAVTPWNENYAHTMPFSNTNLNVLLSASTAISYTVPGNETQTYRANFSVSTSADVWVRLNGTAQVPTTNTIDQSSYQERIGVDFNRYVKGGDTISFISTGTPQVGVSLLQVQST